MLALLLLHFLASFAGYQSSQTVSIVQIGITLVSLVSGYLAAAWVGDLDCKGVDLEEVIVAVEARVAEAEQARQAQGKGGKQPLVSNAGEDQSSNDTDRSETSSHGLDDVIQELEQLGKDKSHGPTSKLDDSAKQPLLNTTGAAEGPAAQPLRAGDFGTALLPPDGEQAERTPGVDALTRGLIPAPGAAADRGAKTGSPRGGGAQASLPPASPRAAASAPEDANALRPAEKLNQVELDTNISGQDVRA